MPSPTDEHPGAPGAAAATRTVNPDHEQVFAFSWEPLYLAAAVPFGISPANSDVTVTPTELVARYGRWRVRIRRDDIDAVQVTGGYQVIKTFGPPHLSFADRGITFASNRQRGLCIQVRTPVRGIDPWGLVRHPSLTVTVDDPEALARALGFPRS